MKRSVTLDWRKYVGPFPINPYLAAIFTFASILSFSNGLLSYFLTSVEILRVMPVIFIFSLLLGVATTFSIRNLENFRKKKEGSFTLYLLEVLFITALLSLIGRAFIFAMADLLKVELPLIAGISLVRILSNGVFCLFMLALLHQFEELVNVRFLNSKSQLLKLRTEKKILVEADEEIRRQVAQYLHDRVQSELMVSVIQLKSLKEKKPQDYDSELESVFKRLERIRSVDLSKLAQILAPNFSVGGLVGSLELLIHQYNSNFKTTLKVDNLLGNLDESSMLGIYRIIEQALLNVITHGPSKNVEIEIHRQNANTVSLAVKDDGPGSYSNHIGVGTTIIDSWVELMSGDKRVETTIGQGYTLLVTLNIPS